MQTELIRAKIRSVKRAKADLSAVVARVFPVGADISWDKCGHRQYGTVQDHGRTGEVLVKNDATGKSYWIGMYDVVGYVE